MPQMAQYTFEDVQAPHTIEAKFETDVEPPVFHTITAVAGGGGDIEPGGLVQVLQGGNQTFLIKASPGFHIKAVLVDGVEVNYAATTPKK